MKICLLGTAPDSFGLAPFESDYEIWSCSPGTMGARRVDKLFELHRWEPGQPWFQPAYIEYLNNFKGEVIMSAPVSSVKGCKVLPYEDLVQKYGPYFFTSSLAWMMAMAIEAGATKIALYGVDMAATTEYHDQRMGCQYFAMLAKSMGIEVGVPPESDLLRPAPLYGVCENSHAWIKATARARDLARRVQEHQTLVDQNNNRINFLKGAMDDQDWHLHSWIGNMDTMGQEFISPPDVPVLERLRTEQDEIVHPPVQNFRYETIAEPISGREQFLTSSSTDMLARMIDDHKAEIARRRSVNGDTRPVSDALDKLTQEYEKRV